MKIRPWQTNTNIIILMRAHSLNNFKGQSLSSQEIKVCAKLLLLSVVAICFNIQQWGGRREEGERRREGRKEGG